MSREGTPLMQQYREIKARHQDAILMFRMGDFYEMFFDDAHVASRVLGLTLTARNNGGAADVPLAGVPVKAVQEYIRRLVDQGFRVAICEQVEDPRQAKGIVRREVVETVTPGAVFADDLLDAGRHNFLCAVLVKGQALGIAAIDVSIGSFCLVRCAAADGEAMLARYAPRELLIVRGGAVGDAGPTLRAGGALVTERDGWEFDPALGREEIARLFRVHTLEGLGIGIDDDVVVGAAGALLRYVHELQPAGIPQLERPRVERSGQCMPLDEMTRRNLELVESLRTGPDVANGRGAAERSGTLLGVLDRTQTPMGARLLRQWLLAPLLDREAIIERLDAVERCLALPMVRATLRAAIDGVRDIERLAGKAASGRSSPRELRALGDSLLRLPAIGGALRDIGTAGALRAIVDGWDDCDDVSSRIRSQLVERPPSGIGDEDVIAAGADAALDELRGLRDGSRDAIAQVQAAERGRTGIASLKVGYNRVFGYFIEVTNANKHLVPDDYQRRQTLTGAERYITTALKEYEEKILHATEHIEARERALFDELREATGREILRLQSAAQRVAALDVYASLAEVAETERYVRPDVLDSFELEITGGRHPVVERMMPREKFIPNDLSLVNDARVVVLTGPNMAGKSTVLRQVGLIVLMSQMGSFVPATKARIGVVDRLFTRVGASDNLVRGQSTFMVEMAETSAILHTATDRSLVLLDEIGRGTSTYDGVSIAWAVTEHLHNTIGCKTVFATHYHELTQLADELSSLRNYNVAVREAGDEVLFLHRLQPGGADRSYGIEVGRLAGLPRQVIERARAILRLLEGEQLVSRPDGTVRTTRDATGALDPQLTLFHPASHPVLTRLREIDPEHTTPFDALKLLTELTCLAREP
ncbi:MAG: DNA mismatch repair protein MutS [Gemmatimonadaceae bacterium]|nr:DNA mismatch repair protein MutS [Gemmatimonadaceae bacterium]